MADVVNASNGTYSDYGAAITKPSGSGAGLLVIAVTWFYQDGTPSISGWSLLDKITDGSSGTNDACTTAILYKVTADLSSEASTFTVSLTAGGDQKGRCYFFTGVNATTPIVAGSKVSAGKVTSTIAVPNYNVTLAGSFSLLGCGDWNFSTWQLSGFGGGQTMPSGFSAFTPSSSSEYGDFYKGSLATGNVGGSFGAQAQQFAVVQAIIQPAVSVTPTYPAYSKFSFID